MDESLKHWEHDVNLSLLNPFNELYGALPRVPAFWEKDFRELVGPIPVKLARSHPAGGDGKHFPAAAPKCRARLQVKNRWPTKMGRQPPCYSAFHELLHLHYSVICVLRAL